MQFLGGDALNSAGVSEQLEMEFKVRRGRDGPMSLDGQSCMLLNPRPELQTNVQFVLIYSKTGLPCDQVQNKH